MANYKSNNDSDSASLKLAAAVGGVVVVCFCLGYFVIGKGMAGPNKTDASPIGVVTSTNNGVVQAGTQKPPTGGDFIVIDNTEEVKAKRKKAEEEAKKKADEEAKKKAEEEAKKKAAQEALENMASPTPTASLAAPDPDDLPDASPTPEPDESPVVEPTPTPTPEPTPKPVSTPKPAPSPKPVPSTPPSTPDDPEDIAMSNPPPSTGTNPAPLGPLYRVRVGSFVDRSSADSLATELKNHGYATSLTTENQGGKTIYRLQVGAYRNEKTAREFAKVIDKELEPNGLKTTISLH